jgi:hypothetical protein
MHVKESYSNAVGEKHQPRRSAYCFMEDQQRQNKEWLTEAMRPNEPLAMDFVCVYDHVEKLIEAAWLLHTGKPKKKKKKRR